MFSSCTLLLRRDGHRHLKHLSTTATTTRLPADLPLSHPTFLVWASNTSLGKTLVSAGLAASSLLSKSHSRPRKFLYLKPVQTGFPSDSDSSFVYRKLSRLSLRRNSLFPLFSSNHVLRASVPAANAVLGQGVAENGECGIRNLGWYEERRFEGERASAAASELVCKTLYAWRDPVSPHLAAQRENAVVEDAAVLRELLRCLRVEMEGGGDEKKEMDVFCVVETAGGIASPGPSGSLQCDLYRPLRLPAILVGDGRLGGISGTISAYESLKLRGYNVVAVVFEDHGLVNEVPLLSYLRNRVPVLVLPPIPEDLSNDLMEWFDESCGVFDSLKEKMLSAYSERIKRLHDMPKKAREIFWWPFTQHKLVPEGAVTVIDSRYGENFAIFKDQNNGFITQQFDACASWWTQGPDATLQTELARDLGYAAARFGHVMFPENVYEPALKCAELLLEGVGKGWATRAYFSDNGSTAIEIALKMAFRKFSFDHGILSEDNAAGRSVELMVLALRGSYHGDTLGAMEAQAPSAYTGFLQQPWYTGRGLFLDPPTVYMCNGVWNLSLPEGLCFGNPKLENIAFSSRNEIFHRIRDNSDLAEIYSSYISQQLSQYSGSGGFNHIGALILEPALGLLAEVHFIFGNLMLHNVKKDLMSPISELMSSSAFHSIKCSFGAFGPSGPPLLVSPLKSLALDDGLTELLTYYILWLLEENAVILAAGGMHMVDPLFQRVLVNECRSKRIPVIFDEVFTGFWRLGTETAADLLCCVPDIACFAKLMTGGTVPLAATLATNAVFTSFIGDSKLKALLHGHSYSGHAIGCTAAVKSIEWFKDPQTNLNIASEGRLLRELWDEDLVRQISSIPAVQRVVALGTLCALELRAEGHNAGYGSLYASSLLQKLREDGVYTRPLGNVIYLMCGPCTSPELCSQLLVKLHTRLEEFCQTK